MRVWCVGYGVREARTGRGEVRSGEQGGAGGERKIKGVVGNIEGSNRPDALKIGDHCRVQMRTSSTRAFAAATGSSAPLGGRRKVWRDSTKPAVRRSNAAPACVKDLLTTC